MHDKGSRKNAAPCPVVREEKIEKWASQGLTRKMMAERLGCSPAYLCQTIRNSKTLTIAELRGKIKFYE